MIIFVFLFLSAIFQAADFAFMLLRCSDVRSIEILFPRVTETELKGGIYSSQTGAKAEQRYPPLLTAELSLTLGILQQNTQPSKLKGGWAKVDGDDVGLSVENHIDSASADVDLLFTYS